MLKEGAERRQIVQSNRKIPSVSHTILGNASFTLFIQHTFVDHVSYVRLRTRAANSSETQALFCRSYSLKLKDWQVISKFVWYHAPLCRVHFSQPGFLFLSPACQAGSGFRSLYLPLPLPRTLPMLLYG